MKKALWVLFLLLLSVFLIAAGCSKENVDQDIGQGVDKLEQGLENIGEGLDKIEDGLKDTVNSQPDIAGIRLGDPQDVVKTKLGSDYKTTDYDEPGHFPEPYAGWEYADGTTVFIGKQNGKVLEIRTTAPGVGTNLEAKVGDPAEMVFEIYRGKYSEPDSIHGTGKLIGIFKVENGAAMIFDFNIEDGIANPKAVKPEDKVQRIILTYPAFIDESF